MRLWHKSLIEILPRQQLLGQWRECCLIAKGLHDGNLNHILVNRVKDYPLEHFHYYSGMISDEMERRKYKCNYFTFDRWLHFEKNHCRYNELFDGWHNDRYLRQCLYNLEEKAICGGIPADEWQRIYDVYGKRYDLWDDIHELKMSVSGYNNDALDVSLIYEVLGEIPAVDVQPIKYGWIPTSERFPERFALVLFSVNFGLVEEGFYMGAKWKGLASNAIYRNDDITAWQTLPNPYHAESEDATE